MSYLSKKITTKNASGGLGPNKFPHPADFPEFIPERIPAPSSIEAPRTRPQSDWTEVEWSILRNLLNEFKDPETGNWFKSLLDAVKKGLLHWSQVLPSLETLHKKVVAHYNLPDLTKLPVFPRDSKGPSPYL